MATTNFKHPIPGFKGVVWYDDGTYTQKVPYASVQDMADALTGFDQSEVTVTVFADITDTQTIDALRAVTPCIGRVIDMFGVPYLL